uniref:Uncharacterized protein n=1 Tax=Picea glauca TaxID=3330 RepID=A0A101LX68_PICGL|nr:hypothetical protein ABT39_MTgene6011 [Picea glauca]
MIPGRDFTCSSSPRPIDRKPYPNYGENQDSLSRVLNERELSSRCSPPFYSPFYSGGREKDSEQTSPARPSLYLFLSRID